MTKQEIIDKVYDEYMKDYNDISSLSTRESIYAIEEACESEFEKEGIEYDHSEVRIAIENKRAYDIINKYIKGYTDTLESSDSAVKYFMVRYKQGLDAGDIEYRDDEFKRAAEVFKEYDGYEYNYYDNMEDKNVIDSLKKDVNQYLSEHASDKESVQTAYKAINDYIYGDTSFDNLNEQTKGIDPADMKEAFSKVIDDNSYLKSSLSIVENPNRNNSDFILRDYHINPDMRDNLNNIYDKYLIDNIEDISKESREIQMTAKMHSIIEDYDRAYKNMNDYLDGKTTELNETGKAMNQYAVMKAFRDTMLKRDEIDISHFEITDKHVDICKSYDIPRTNLFPEPDIGEYDHPVYDDMFMNALSELKQRVANSLAKEFSDDKETQNKFKDMYCRIKGSFSVRQSDMCRRRDLDCDMDDRYSRYSNDTDAEIEDTDKTEVDTESPGKAAANAFMQVIKCDNVQNLLTDIKEGDMTHNLDVMMRSPDCNFYSLINAYEMSGAREQIGNMITEACKTADDPNNVRPNEVGLTADEIRDVIKIEEIINAEEELSFIAGVMQDYIYEDIDIEEMKEILSDNECQPEFIANAFADLLNNNSSYRVDIEAQEQKLKNIYKELNFDSPEFKEVFDNVQFYHLSDFVQIRNETRADNEFQKWMSDPERNSIDDLRKAVFNSVDHRTRNNASCLISQSVENAPAEMIVDSQMSQKLVEVSASHAVSLRTIQNLDEVKENNPEAANKFQEDYKDNVKEAISKEITTHAKWGIEYIYQNVQYDIDCLCNDVDENDKADVIVSAVNTIENKRLMGEINMSKTDVEVYMANVCFYMDFTKDKSIDALDEAVEQNPQVKDMTDNMMKIAVFMDMAIDYGKGLNYNIFDIKNAASQIDKSMIEKVVDDVSSRMRRTPGCTGKKIDEIEEIKDECTKNEKVDFGQDDISYDDDDDHDDH